MPNGQAIGPVENAPSAISIMARMRDSGTGPFSSLYALDFRVAAPMYGPTELAGMPITDYLRRRF